jgi:hypothetical protein
MSKAEQFEALALWCEQATGPDRELDAAIWLLCVPGATRKQWSYVHIATERTCEIDETRDGSGKLIIVPTYSASLDAALTLVPAEANCFGFDSDPKTCEAYCSRNHVAGGHWIVSREAATPALALCAAALRARAQV